MKTGRLTLSGYFQRNLVWRDTHRRDFIDTILKGYPFPQIFLARGPINLETMEASQAVVDGQQRLNTIKDFVSGNLDVGQKFFNDFTEQERESFLRYEVPVIDFDLESGDPRLKDVFHRLNRTFCSLSAIEKLASEYSASEFMLIARLLSGEILKVEPSDEEFGTSLEDAEGAAISANIFSRDPGIDDETWSWLTDRAEGTFAQIIRSRKIFSPFEFDRKVPLMFTLNIQCTYLAGYYERNDKVRKFLDENATEFPEKEEIIQAIDQAADFIRSMNLSEHSNWWNKANFFSLMCELSRQPELRDVDPARARDVLESFLLSMPADYALAQKEATGRKPQRELRGATIRKLLISVADEEPRVMVEI
nr:DUF262 domain-containing protein [Brevundimonas sp.]